MSPTRPVFLPIFFLFCLPVTLLGPQPGAAQQPKGPSPGTRRTPTPRPASDQEQFIAYWTSETGWSSELQLRNNTPSQNLTVTPVLRSANGAETSLAPVTVAPQEVKSVDVGAAIFDAGAPQLIGTYGSVVLRYRSPYAASLYAAMMIRKTGHAVAFHIDAIGESQEFQSGSREGVWWLPKDTTSDYLIVANQGKDTIPLGFSLFDANGKESRQKLSLAPAQTTRYSVRQLLQAAGLGGSYGGIKIAANTHSGSLNTLHFLFDETAGFSAILKMFDYNPQAKLEERDYARTGAWTLRAPMLALSNPDVALAFPPGTILQPQLFLRNNTGKPLDVSLRFNWRAGSSTGKAAGPQLRLNPFETRRIDVAALQDGNTLPKQANWASVTITTNSKPDELMAVAASYDSTLRYGAQTPFSDQLTFKWEGGMWEFDPYHNSIIAAGNGGTEPTQAAFTIFYNQGTQKYELEQTLLPDEQMWIDVGKLIREQVPDKNGKTLPADLTSGSYEFRDLTHTGAGRLFEGKVIYDKTYGHVAYGCAACCGYDTTSVVLAYDPLLVIFNNIVNQDVVAPDMCQGGALSVVDSSFFGAWSTANTNIATVDHYGAHRGAGVGTTSSFTSGRINDNDALRNCPLVGVDASGTDNVATLSCNPSSVTRGGSVTCSVSNAPTGATFSSWQFKDSSNNTVNGSGNGSSWGGVMVTTGTVSVQVAAGGGPPKTPSATVTVTARSGFAFTAVAAAQRANPYNAGACNISVPTSPAAGNFLGFSCLDQQYYQTPYLVGGNGPNNGFRYVYSASNSNNNVPTTFNFIIAGYLDDSGSEFAQKQWGNCGFISYNQLKSNTYEHESGNTTGHYATYKSTQDNSANNLGVAVEAIVGPPGQSETDFNNQVRTVFNSKGSTIVSAAFPTPENFCNSDVRYDPACVFRGNINWPVYASCP